MTFVSPGFLVGLLLLPVMVALYVRAERRPVRLASAGVLPSVLPRRAGWRRHAAIGGYGLALAALLVALAKPQATMAVQTDQARVMILTDHSGSMRRTDVKPTRLAAAKRAAATFLATVPDTLKVGAIAFNQHAEVLQSPTTDHDAVLEAIDGVQVSGTTATGDAIETALKELKGTAPAAIVLLTDGKSVRGTDPVVAAREAAQRKIPVYTVALGTPKGAAALAQVARVSGGRSYTAANAAALRRVYQRLGRQVATAPRKVEVTSLFAGGALALMVLSAMTSLGLRGRLV